MIKDIDRPEVKDIAIAIVNERNETGAEEWNVYLLNLKDENIHNILVTSKGYGSIGDERRESSVLRQFFDGLPAGNFVKIEPIMEELFGLTNEFWVSFYIDKTIYDKKFIFLPETIRKENFTKVPIIKQSGVMIK